MTATADDRLRAGQILCPIPARQSATMDPHTIAETYLPVLLRAAYDQGGTLTGTPEILSEGDLRPRLEDPAFVELVDDNPDCLWVLATMVPHDWSHLNDTPPISHVHRPVVPGGPRRVRRGRRRRG